MSSPPVIAATHRRDVSNVEFYNLIKEADTRVHTLARCIALHVDPSVSHLVHGDRFRRTSIRAVLALRAVMRTAPIWGASYGAGAGFGAERGAKMVGPILSEARRCRHVLFELMQAMRRADHQAAAVRALRLVIAMDAVFDADRYVTDELCEARTKAFNAKQAKRKRDAAYRARKAEAAA